MTTNQEIITKITNIKIPGIASLSYWSIFKTASGIYFVQSGSDMFSGLAGPIAGAIGDMLGMMVNKMSSNDLSSALKSAIQYVKINNDQYSQIKITPRLFGGAIIQFPSGREKSWNESGFIKLKLSRKKYKDFLMMLK